MSTFPYNVNTSREDSDGRVNAHTKNKAADNTNNTAATAKPRETPRNHDQARDPHAPRDAVPVPATSLPDMCTQPFNHDAAPAYPDNSS